MYVANSVCYNYYLGSRYSCDAVYFMTVGSNGYASSTQVGSAGALYCSSGGVITNTRIYYDGYVQVYDRKDHKWIDMTEWAFIGMEEHKKSTQGKAYVPPSYLD